MNNIQRVRQHNQQMEQLYAPQIKQTVENTKIYDAKSNFINKSGDKLAYLSFLPVDTFSAVFKIKQCYPGKTTALNFADYLQAGGAYLTGAMAQEEALCQQSDLYQCLKPFETSYYQWNRQHVNHALYENRALYSPAVVVTAPAYAQVDIITCAAPFYTQTKNAGITYQQACQVLKQRMFFVKQIAENEQVDNLILGAWGAGVFGFQPKDVAHYWHQTFQTPSSVKRVIFAVINDHHSQSAQAFAQEFMH